MAGARKIKFGRTTEKDYKYSNFKQCEGRTSPGVMSAEAKHCSGTQSNEQRQRGDVPLCRLDKPLVLFSLEQHASWFFPFAVRCVVAPSGRGGCWPRNWRFARFLRRNTIFSYQA